MIVSPYTIRRYLSAAADLANSTKVVGPMKKRGRSQTQCCEIVRVNSPIFLVNSVKRACRYEMTDGKPLAAGYYLVLWPTRTTRCVYGPDLRFLGPLETMRAALLLRTSALAWGITDAEVEDYPAAVPANWHRAIPMEPSYDIGLGRIP